jgi:signal transduction histidine kinase
MLVFFPVFLLFMAVIAWRVIGSALRPVEELRHGADRIGAAADPTERLPVPPSRDEVSALAATLNGMLERLSSASARQRAFVADAAHELRSPLASMRTQLEVAARLGEGGTLSRDLLADVDRLTALVEDLLVLARSGEDAPPHARQQVDVASLLGEVARRYAVARVPVRVQQPRAARMREDPPGSHAAVIASADDLLRALGNLVDNAVRHARTLVTLSWESGPWGTRVTVRDDGNGIPEADRERVFDRFARLDEARDRDSGGSGLGLPITRELLRRNGARVSLEDAQPGTRAVVTFGP